MHLFIFIEKIISPWYIKCSNWWNYHMKKPTKTIKHTCFRCIYKMYIRYHLPWIAKYISAFNLEKTQRKHTQLVSIFLRYTVHDHWYFERARMLRARVTTCMRICKCKCKFVLKYCLFAYLFIWKVTILTKDCYTRHLRPTGPGRDLYRATRDVTRSLDLRDSPYLVAFCDKQGILRTDVVTLIFTGFTINYCTHTFYKN